MYILCIYTSHFHGSAIQIGETKEEARKAPPMELIFMLSRRIRGLSHPMPPREEPWLAPFIPG